MCSSDLGLATTPTGGPHGLHTIGQSWVDKHGDYAEKNRQACAYCHGADFRGSPLAVARAARDFKADDKRVHYTEAQQVTCYDCHNGPGGDSKVVRRR